MQPENNMQNSASGPKLEAVVEEVTAMETKPVATEPSKSDIVFNDKPKKNSSMILGMVLLAILAIGGIGFGVWAMLDGNAQKENLNNQISSLTTQNNELLEQIGASDSDNIVDVNADLDTWEYFSNNLLKRPMIATGGYWHYTGSDNEYKMVSAHKDAEGQLTININGEDVSADGFENVILVYFVHYGNGADAYFYVIEVDGSVYRMEVAEGMTYELEKVGDYTKIISVVENGDLSNDLIDINGNVYNLREQ